MATASQIPPTSNILSSMEQEPLLNLPLPLPFWNAGNTSPVQTSPIESPLSAWCRNGGINGLFQPVEPDGMRVQSPLGPAIRFSGSPSSPLRESGPSPTRIMGWPMDERNGSTSPLRQLSPLRGAQPASAAELAAVFPREETPMLSPLQTVFPELNKPSSPIGMACMADKNGDAAMTMHKLMQQRNPGSLRARATLKRGRVRPESDFNVHDDNSEEPGGTMAPGSEPSAGGAEDQVGGKAMSGGEQWRQVSYLQQVELQRSIQEQLAQQQQSLSLGLGLGVASPPRMASPTGPSLTIAQLQQAIKQSVQPAPSLASQPLTAFQPPSQLQPQPVQPVPLQPQPRMPAHAVSEQMHVSSGMRFSQQQQHHQQGVHVSSSMPMGAFSQLSGLNGSLNGPGAGSAAMDYEGEPRGQPNMGQPNMDQSHMGQSHMGQSHMGGMQGAMDGFMPSSQAGESATAGLQRMLQQQQQQQQQQQGGVGTMAGQALHNAEYALQRAQLASVHKHQHQQAQQQQQQQQQYQHHQLHQQHQHQPVSAASSEPPSPRGRPAPSRTACVVPPSPHRRPAPARRPSRAGRAPSAPLAPTVDMMTCCVQLQAEPGQPPAAVTKALEALAAKVKAEKAEEKRPTKRVKSEEHGADDAHDDDDAQDNKLQSPIERHKLLAWRPPCNPKINMDVFKSKDQVSHSVNVKGAKSWHEFAEAVDELMIAAEAAAPGVKVRKVHERVALTKSSFHIGHPIDLGQLVVPEAFAEVCQRKRRAAHANDAARCAKTNGGLVLKLKKWDAKVMLHGNGRGDMWWPTDDVAKMTEAYHELCAHFREQNIIPGPADSPHLSSEPSISRAPSADPPPKVPPLAPAFTAGRPTPPPAYMQASMGQWSSFGPSVG